MFEEGCASNKVPYLQMTSVGSHSTPGREKESMEKRRKTRSRIKLYPERADKFIMKEVVSAIKVRNEED